MGSSCSGAQKQEDEEKWEEMRNQKDASVLDSKRRESFH